MSELNNNQDGAELDVAAILQEAMKNPDATMWPEEELDRIFNIMAPTDKDKRLLIRAFGLDGRPKAEIAKLTDEEAEALNPILARGVPDFTMQHDVEITQDAMGGCLFNEVWVIAPVTEPAKAYLYLTDEMGEDDYGRGLITTIEEGLELASEFRRAGFNITPRGVK